MALNPLLVHVEKPDGILFSHYFTKMRIWLDAHKIEPVDFRLLGGCCIGLDVRFASSEEANHFEREFGLEADLTNLSSGFVARAASQASMTRTMSGNDQSMSDTPAV
jgi:hypothetical protein